MIARGVNLHLTPSVSVRQERLEKDVMKRARTRHDCRASLHEVQVFLLSHVRIGTIGGVLQSHGDRDLSLEPRRARPPAVPFDVLAKKELAKLS